MARLCESRSPKFPSPVRVARRGLVLYMIASRAAFEVAPDRKQAKLCRSNVLTRIKELALDDELEPNEYRILRAPVGSLDQQTVVSSIWRYEGAAVLAWALKRLTLPPVDVQVSDVVVGDVFFNLDFDVPLKLRSRKVLSEYEELMYNLHWRAVHWYSHPGPYDLRRMISDVSALPQVPAVHFLKKDLGVGSQPIFQAPQDAVRSCYGIIKERRWAASWLVGDHPTYSQVALDT